MIEDLKHKLKNYKPYINGYKNMKRASVLIPIVKKDNTHYILFQVRSKNLKTQPNEISFPGGKIEINENPLDTVIRETCEELGTTVKNINIISPLDLLITPGNMIIHPFVGYIDNIDNLNLNKDEVDHIFLVPISYLLENDPCLYNNEVKVIPNENFPYDIIPNKENYKFSTSNYRVLFYKYENYVIWGITAKILENFLEFLEI
ncbi:MAG TPA: CoA pyrophosphatase [Romboutsia timonensis]|uniref:CoA pyrophosphatase n=1 Tax=Romboutsia timonensis TaxID=1776391 RepID=A0A921MZC5_9FIRM|nr:CoA pyrophosphatase [uncultured Romboutsia sp.]HJG95805.1 CoA pyrophosphatase [Romboutsia timonensis]